MDLETFIDRYNDLTGLLLRKLGEEAKDKNIVFSPFSILSLLSILADATNGSTRQEIQDFLYGSLSHKGFPEQLKAVRDELTRKDDYSSWLDDGYPYSGKSILDRKENLNTANAVFIKDKYKDSILSSFQKHFKKVYEGGIISSPNLQETVKSWSLDATREMLPLLEEIVKSDSLLAMINTVFFQAMWQYPYENRQIRKGAFHNADHTDSRVVMLYGGGDSFVENDLATGFVKDFQQCGYTFLALLPKEKGQDALHAVMNSVDFSGLMDRQRYVILRTKMPEFKLSFRTELIEMMRSLGIRKAFSMEEADFSSMSAIPLVADQMVHQAKIEVDRNGARAAAATALVSCGAGLPEEEKHVLIDRPFIFAIMNQQLKIPVFVGAVNHIDSIDEV